MSLGFLSPNFLPQLYCLKSASSFGSARIKNVGTHGNPSLDISPVPRLRNIVCVRKTLLFLKSILLLLLHTLGHYYNFPEGLRFLETKPGREMFCR